MKSKFIICIIFIIDNAYIFSMLIHYISEIRAYTYSHNMHVDTCTHTTSVKNGVVFQNT